MIRILFLCHGNICRSPMAEFIMKDLIEKAGRGAEFTVASAAVSAEELGNDMYPPAKRTLTAHGVPFTRRAARQVTRADYGAWDRILCMDGSNLRLLRRILGEDVEGKVSLLMSHAGESRDVADPWYTGDFEATYRDVLRGCEGLLAEF